jgi:hypothetical protein
MQSPGICLFSVERFLYASTIVFDFSQLSLWCWRTYSDHIISRQRPPDRLQLELTDRLDLHGILDLHQHSRTDEDLPWLGLVAKPRGDVGDRANGGIVEAAFKADGAERGEAVRDADAEANLVPEPTPLIGKFKFREAEPGRDLSARSRQVQLTFGTKYVAMEARYPLASARRDI